MQRIVQRAVQRTVQCVKQRTLHYQQRCCSSDQHIDPNTLPSWKLSATRPYPRTPALPTRECDFTVADDQALPRLAVGRVNKEKTNWLKHATCYRHIFRIVMRAATSIHEK